MKKSLKFEAKIDHFYIRNCTLNILLLCVINYSKKTNQQIVVGMFAVNVWHLLKKKYEKWKENSEFNESMYFVIKKCNVKSH